MKQSFFFYDLETSGLNSRTQRIMQFAGQRTDMNLKPIGEPINVRVRLSDDILPDPGAIMVTGITPQQTVADGISEPELCRLLVEEVFTPGTITVGYNNVRFDDEFIRHTLWRNFYDPYEWAWKDDRSRWDLLDVVRLVRALRPDGIEWPVDDAGKPVNKLELLATANDLIHTSAHDALSDVEALIQLAKLLRGKQPKMFDYLLSIRGKKQVAELVDTKNPKPFVYASGRYDAEHHKTTVAIPIAAGTKPNSVLVYDLRHDPSSLKDVKPADIAKRLFAKREQRVEPGFQPVPVKELVINRCPAVAPLGVLDETAQKNIGLTLKQVEENLAKLSEQTDLGDRVREAFDNRDAYTAAEDVEGQLYDSFTPDADKARLSVIRAADADELADFAPNFTDERLPELLLRYKARWFPTSLSDDGQAAWEEYRHQKLAANIEPFMKALQKQAQGGQSDFLVEELKLWAESIVPAAN